MSAPPVPNSMTLYKRLLGYLKPYWQRFAISLVALAIAAATEPAFARLMKPLVDGGFVARDGWSMIWTPMAIVGLFLLRGITSFINDYTTTALAGQVVMTLRQEMFDKLLRLPIGYYNDNASGRVLSRITNDVNQVTDAGFNIITVVVKDGIRSALPGAANIPFTVIQGVTR